MIALDRARALIERLQGEGLVEAEVLLKTGRSRRSEIGAQGSVSVFTEEMGWALRAGHERGSLFACGTGPVRLDGERPKAGGAPLSLPDAQHVPLWDPGSDLDAPLAVEAEAYGVLEGIERELQRQVPSARLLRAVLDDGSSETRLISSRGVDCSFRSRLATLHLEAVWGARAATRSRLEVVALDARALQPRALARRLADSLVVRAGDAGPSRERGEMVLAPAVGARLLAALGPLWLGGEAASLSARLADRQDRLASPAVRIVDDPRLRGGGVAAPVDGEGVPTRRVVLVEGGRFVRALVDWRRTPSQGRVPAGFMRRPGWRDRPRLGASHLYLEPDVSLAASELVSGVSRGFYLLDALGPARVDFDGDRMAIPVCGFGLDQGRATATLGRAWLTGSISALLHGIRAVARDLAFLPLAGAMIGAPTLLVTGLELRRDLDLPG
jgi:predicted Zn-dependent protease